MGWMDGRGGMIVVHEAEFTPARPVPTPASAGEMLTMKKTLVLGLLLAAIGVPASLHAQDPAAAPGDVAAEMQQIRERLSSLQQRALADTAVQRANDSLGAVMQARAAEVDPNYNALVTRATQFQAEVAAATAAEDNERLTALASEGETLQVELEASRARLMADPAVQEEFNAFRQTLFGAMVALDPEAPALVQRLEELSVPR